MSVGPLLRGRGARVLALVLLLSSCGSGGDENVTPAEAAGSTDAAVTIDAEEPEESSIAATPLPDRSTTTSAVPDEMALADTSTTV